MTTEDKIKEAFLDWNIEQFGGNAGPFYEDAFKAGYMACLNGLEPLGWYTDKDGVRHDYSYRLPEGVTK